MKGFEFILLFMVSIDGKLLEDIDGDSINVDELLVEGDESKFSAVLIMKPNGHIEDTFWKQNEPENRESSDIPFIKMKKENADVDPLSIVPLLLRKKPWKGCMKTASKICTKACGDAYKDACAFYSCERKLQKELKRQCKHSCKNNFLGPEL